MLAQSAFSEFKGELKTSHEVFAQLKTSEDKADENSEPKKEFDFEMAKSMMRSQAMVDKLQNEDLNKSIELQSPAEVVIEDEDKEMQTGDVFLDPLSISEANDKLLTSEPCEE